MVRDSDILQFLHDRLVNVHGEHENYDYMHNLRRIIQEKKDEEAALGDHGRLSGEEIMRFAWTTDPDGVHRGILGRREE